MATDSTPMTEYECWLVRVDDGSVVSRHNVLATELDGDLVEVATPDLPLDMPASCVLVTGLPGDVAGLMRLLTTSAGTA